MSSFASVYFITLLFSIFFWYLNKIFKTPKRISPQTFHKKSTSRLGGAAIFLGLFIEVFALNDADIAYPNLSTFLICSIPIFLVGLADDIFLNLKPLSRILLMVPSPLLFYYYGGVEVMYLDIFFLDWLFQYHLFSLVFIIFSFIGIANAFNIVDGFNGLLLSYVLSICVSIFLFGNLYTFPSNYLNVIVASVLALLTINIFGKIFMGDGGAYFLGCLIASGLIVLHNSMGYSPWFVLCLFIYPVTEVIFSFIRKVIYRKRSAMEPDGLHLHMLIYKRISKKIGFRKHRLRHLIVTVFMILINFPFMIAANTYATNSTVLFVICIWYFLVYAFIYFTLIPKFAFKK